MEIKRTITTLFMVPTLGIPKEALESSDFINGYIRDDSRDIQYPDSICLLFHPSNFDKFKIFLEKEYERTKSLLDDYDYNNGFVVLVYRLDTTFKEDFKLIMQSKYSKTSPEFQRLFPKVKKRIVNGLFRDEIALQYRIFNRTQDLISFWEEKFGIVMEPDQEVWSRFNEKDEILTKICLIGS